MIGPRFTPAALATLLDIGEPEAARRCQQISRSGLIRLTGNGYEFANEILQQAVHDATPTPTRIAYQRRAAQAAHSEQPRHRVRATGRPLTGSHT